MIIIDTIAPGIKYLSTASEPNIPIPAAAPAKFKELPVIIPSKINIAASIGSMPALVIIGIAIEPIMIIAPSPLIPKNTNAVAPVSKIAIAIGLSPDNSAAFFIIASDIPVLCITLANIEPKITSIIGALNRNEPFNNISLSQSKNGTSLIIAIHAAINGRAKSVGNMRTIISTAKNTKPTINRIPDSVKIDSSIKIFMIRSRQVVYSIAENNAN